MRFKKYIVGFYNKITLIFNQVYNLKKHKEKYSLFFVTKKFLKTFLTLLYFLFNGFERFAALSVDFVASPADVLVELVVPLVVLVF